MLTARHLWIFILLGKTLFAFATVDSNLAVYQNLKSICWKPVCRSW